MTYKETLDYLYAALPMYQRIGGIAYKANLNNAYKLDHSFGHEHRSFKTIHVAGTNGKGSVSHMLASVLQSAGYNTGLYTSPHLLDFRERIKVNGECIPEKYVIDFTEKNKKLFGEVNPSFFEMTVFLAFNYFAFQKVDIAVIEVGLGGRLDTTNVIIPEVSIITNIGYDHTQFLGNTLQEIASEKAGIIKNNIPVVISETQKEIKDIFIRSSREHHAQIWFADEYYVPDYSLQEIDSGVVWHFSKCQFWNFEKLKIDLQGQYQKRNLPAVLSALWLLKQKDLDINKQSIESGLLQIIRQTDFHGRWEILSHTPLTICDTAHNTEGFAQVIDQIRSIPYKHLHFVLGFVEDKKLNPIVKLLPEKADYYLCEPAIPRAMKLDHLESFFKNRKLAYSSFDSVASAYASALANSSPDDLVYIGGSTFVIADLLRLKK